MSSSFRPTGGAHYARSDEDRSTVVFDPTNLRRLGDAPWRFIRAISDDGMRIAGEGEDGPTLFDARSGTVLARLALPSEVDAGDRAAFDPGSDEHYDDVDDELAEDAPRATYSPFAFAFTPGTHRLWGCAHALSPASDGRALANHIHCRRFGASGTTEALFDAPMHHPIERYFAVPISIESVGPELVIGEGERLVVAAMRDVRVLANDGTLLHADDDHGVEAMITGAIEAPDGRSIAVATSAALGWWSDREASATLCPGLVGQRPALLFATTRPTQYQQRFECHAGGRRPIAQEAILGVSHDGRSMLLGDGDLFDGEGGLVLRAGSARRRIAGVSTFCQNDGCGPNARFLPGDRFFELDGVLFDGRTGRRVRELAGDEQLDAVAPSGTRAARITGEPHRRAVSIYDVATATELHHQSSSDEEPRVTFVDDERLLVLTRDALAMITVGQPELTWRRSLDALSSVAIGRTTVGVLLGGRVRALALATGAPVGPLIAMSMDRPAPPSDALMRDNDPPPSSQTHYLIDREHDRIAWCESGELRVLTLGEAQPRALGPCYGTPIHLGARFAITAEGSMARVTRLEDGAALWLRVIVRPLQTAWTIAEDDNGHWFTDRAAFPHLRLRAAGPLLTAPLSDVNERAPGYDAALLSRFFQLPTR